MSETLEDLIRQFIVMPSGRGEVLRIQHWISLGVSVNLGTRQIYRTRHNKPFLTKTDREEILSLAEWLEAELEKG